MSDVPEPCAHCLLLCDLGAALTMSNISFLEVTNVTTAVDIYSFGMCALEVRRSRQNRHSLDLTQAYTLYR